jgi:hypothetical protein
MLLLMLLLLLLLLLLPWLLLLLLFLPRLLLLLLLLMLLVLLLLLFSHWFTHFAHCCRDVVFVLNFAANPGFRSHALNQWQFRIHFDSAVVTFTIQALF